MCFVRFCFRFTSLREKLAVETLSDAPANVEFAGAALWEQFVLFVPCVR